MKLSEQIIHIEFNNPKAHLHFGSLAAVYEYLTSEDVGISLNALYRKKSFKEKGQISTNKCIITRAEVLRKKHKPC